MGVAIITNFQTGKPTHRTSIVMVSKWQSLQSQVVNLKIKKSTPVTPLQCCLSEAKRRFQSHVRIWMAPLNGWADPTAEQARLEKTQPSGPLKEPLPGVNTILWTPDGPSLHHVHWFLFQLAHLLRITSTHASVDKNRKATEEKGDGNTFYWYLTEKTNKQNHTFVMFLSCYKSNISSL